jgi:mono/diheme cytochrome c family protein
MTPKDEDATLAFYQERASALTNATTGIGAFSDTFYSFARANCASCHGVSQAPLFAVSDVNAAYAVAKNAAYVNFSSPSESKLAGHSGDGHCGLPGCQSNADVATDMISAWAAVELAGNGDGGTGSGPVIGGGPVTGGANSSAFISQSLAIPANLPTGTSYVPMRWQLSQLTPASALVSGAVFELEVQKLSDTTYRVRNPKIAGLQAPVRVSGIHVFVKPSTDAGIGVEDLGAGSAWESDIVVVPATNLPGTFPTGPLSTSTYVPLDPFSMVIGIRSNQDSFTVSFDYLDSAATLTPTFASIDSNILSTKCVSCHNTGNTSGTGYSFSSYNETLGAVKAGNPGGSALYTSVTGANPDMPTGSIKLTTTETNAISTWITNGAQNN